MADNLCLPFREVSPEVEAPRFSVASNSGWVMSSLLLSAGMAEPARSPAAEAAAVSSLSTTTAAIFWPLLAAAEALLTRKVGLPGLGTTHAGAGAGTGGGAGGTGVNVATGGAGRGVSILASTAAAEADTRRREGRRAGKTEAAVSLAVAGTSQISQMLEVGSGYPSAGGPIGSGG